MLFWPIFGDFWFPVVTLVTFSSNISNFERNPKKPEKNPKKIKKKSKKFKKSKTQKKSKKSKKIQKKSKKIQKIHQNPKIVKCSTDTTVGWTKNTQKPNFFEKRKKSSKMQKLKNV